MKFVDHENASNFPEVQQGQISSKEGISGPGKDFCHQPQLSR